MMISPVGVLRHVCWITISLGLPGTACLPRWPTCKFVGPSSWSSLRARLALRRLFTCSGSPVLPPVDIELSDLVPTPSDVVDVAVWAHIMAIIAAGLVFFLHCGTPCNTFTAARKLDGGPPPLRSKEAPEGLPGLRPSDDCLFSWQFVFRTLG